MKSSVNSDSSRNTKRSRNHGFSLVELLITVSIGMVLMALATPLVQNAMRNYTLNSAASNVARLTQLARYTAIRQGAMACTLLEGNFFGVDADCDGALAANDLRYVLPSGVSPSKDVPPMDSMNFTAEPELVDDDALVISFNARGNKIAAPDDPTIETTVRVIFLEGWGNTSAITVSGAGRARSWRYTGETWF